SSGNMDFSGAFIFYNGEILKNQALSIHVQFKPKYRFNLMKSQNFNPQSNITFTILDVSLYDKTVRELINKKPFRLKLYVIILTALLKNLKIKCKNILLL
ncbi:chemotaxis protein, partial [Campylobacter jejuni]|nr:chemotaxis protein [Campylobacter jejuni]